MPRALFRIRMGYGQTEEVLEVWAPVRLTTKQVVVTESVRAGGDGPLLPRGYRFWRPEHRGPGRGIHSIGGTRWHLLQLEGSGNA